MILTAGQIADVDCAVHLIEQIPFSSLIADKGYDSNALVQTIETSGAQAVISPRSNRLVQRQSRLSPLSPLGGMGGVQTRYGHATSPITFKQYICGQ